MEDTPQHCEYVEEGGGCPAMKPLSKTWCNGRRGHDGKHWCVWILPTGRTEREWWGV